MPVLQMIFFVTTFSCAATELVFHERSGEYWHPSVRPQLNSPGPCYGKPTGKCDAEGHECSCEKPCSPVTYTEDDVVVGAVCSANCAGGHKCPLHPQESPECMKIGSTYLCGIPCSSEKDCPKNAYCQNYGKGYPNLCMYKQ
ncbi:hypothetical protein FOL47_006386 [Perkinsus chesapeaki]|uniref:Uncharacterized protein n=1 Tax=Perkinsus chesapeaki TaxID=330153 RepID=A0A7J6LTK7_PERCH|nr:hypothetical protein FOL47_006386 [Perkinsus chesapeaki]